jgi:YVTN family beta-propeller protein
MRRRLVIGVAMSLVLGACGSVHEDATTAAGVASPPGPTAAAPVPATNGATRSAGIAANVYARTLGPLLAATVRDLPERVYVPNSRASSVDVIDPATFKIVDHFRVGVVPHHVFPSWDMEHLYVGNTASNTLTVLNIHSGRPVRTIPVPDPYNLYFTLDGTKAMVIAERFNRVDFRNPRTWRLIKSIPIPWSGIDHGDFTADGRYWIGSTEYNGVVVRIDTVTMKLAGHLNVGGLPIDARLSPDGKVMYVANQGLAGVTLIDTARFKKVGFIHTGAGAHGLVVSRDTKSLYVSNRLAGSISVIDLATRRLLRTWHVGGSPDMMQVSLDGRQLWVSNRFHASVSVISTRTGKVLTRIKCGAEAHGLTYFPNYGRFSIGHNGVYR